MAALAAFGSQTQVPRIGPNAITQIAAALRVEVGDLVTAEIFVAAGLAHYLHWAPAEMVPEDDVIHLHAALRQRLSPGAARRVGWEAGWATGDYILARRIPASAQWLLRHLPAPIAARLLVAAIRRHAWTFAGSGHFGARAGPPVRLRINGNPLARAFHSADPACEYYAGTFERLFRALVHPNASVRESACEACGDAACRFEIRWSGRR